MSGEELTQYRHEEWNVEFSHPSSWQVQTLAKEEYPLAVRPEHIKEASVQFRILEANDSSLESLLEKLTMDFPLSFRGYETLNKGIQNTKEQEKRAVLVFKHLKDESVSISQEVIYPLTSGTFLFFRATSPEDSWEDLQAAFANVMRSVHYFNPEDIEIVFGEPSTEMKDSPAIEMTFSDHSINQSVGSALPSEELPCVQFHGENEFLDPDLEEASDFKSFASRYEKSWKMCARKEELVSLCKEEEIAKVIWAAAGSHALHWLMEKCTALGGKSAKQCLAHADGISELKQFLMRLNDDGSNLLEISKSLPVYETDNHEALAKFRKLLEVQDSFRGSTDWSREFSRLASQISFYVPDRPYMVDSNGYPYFTAYSELTPQLGNARRMRIGEFVEEATSYKTGLVIDLHREPPARGVMFPFGSLWEFREMGRFLDPSARETDTNFQRNSVNEELSSSLFPGYARAAIREFLEGSLGFKGPKAFQQRNPMDETDISLIINLADFTADQHQIESVTNSLYWFIRTGWNIGSCKSSIELKGVLTPL